MNGAQGDSITPGQIVAGKYRVETLLGSGGMGYVIGARHLTLDERVAIKMLRSAVVGDNEAKVRFFREARASGRMKGEHVARVIDVGEDTTGTPYIVMEHLDGHDLSDILKQRGPFDLRTAVDFVLQACEALAEAHALGIVHRDLKPSNLFLTRRVDGSVCLKVLDFGIAKAVGPVDEAAFTATQSVLGTPQYMAPEQMRSSRRADARSDIWAVGSVLCELLTGAPPFVADTMPELFAMILQDPTPPLRSRRADVPAKLDAVFLRCLEKDATKRFPNVHELAQALAPFGGPDAFTSAARIANVAINVGSPLMRSAPSIPDHPPLAPSASGGAPVASTKSGTTGSPASWIVLVALAAFLALGTVGAILVVRHRRTKAPPTATSVTAADAPPATTTTIAEPPAPPTSAEPPAEPATPTERMPAPIASSAATLRGSKRAAPPKASASAPAPPPPASTKPPEPKPATTASSRYD